MTSPDLPTRPALTLLFTTEHDMVDAAIASIQTRIPEWVPLEGHTEVVLIEALSLIVGQYAYSLNQIPQTVLDGLVELFGIVRKPGVQATATLTVTMPSSITGARTLPSGTRWRVTLGDLSTADLITTEAVPVNPADGVTFTAPVAAENPGVAVNGLPSGTAVELVDPPLSWIESAVLATALAGGTALEADDQFYPRSALSLRRSTTTLVLAEHFTSAALEDVRVGRAKTFDKWDGTGTFDGTDLGHTTVAITTPLGADPAGGDKTAIASALTARALAGLTVHVLGPNLVDFVLNVTVDAQAGFDHAALDTALTAALHTWLSPTTWPWGQVLYANDVITFCQNYLGVLRVTAVSGTAVGQARGVRDLPLTSSTIAVTVNA